MESTDKFIHDLALSIAAQSRDVDYDLTHAVAEHAYTHAHILDKESLAEDIANVFAIPLVSREYYDELPAWVYTIIEAVVRHKKHPCECTPCSRTRVKNNPPQRHTLLECPKCHKLAVHDFKGGIGLKCMNCDNRDTFYVYDLNTKEYTARKLKSNPSRKPAYVDPDPEFHDFDEPLQCKLCGGNLLAGGERAKGAARLHCQKCGAEWSYRYPEGKFDSRAARARRVKKNPSEFYPYVDYVIIQLNTEEHELLSDWCTDKQDLLYELFYYNNIDRRNIPSAIRDLKFLLERVSDVEARTVKELIEKLESVKLKAQNSSKVRDNPKARLPRSRGEGIVRFKIRPEEHELLSNWYSGQGDPLYALLSSNSIDKEDIPGAIRNLESLFKSMSDFEILVAKDLITKLEGRIPGKPEVQDNPKARPPRPCVYLGSHQEPQFFEHGTWLEPEEMAYPSGSISAGRRAAALFPDGKVRIVQVGIPDTFFSIPARAKIKGKTVTGWVGFDETRRGQIVVFHLGKVDIE